jgi:AP2 domain
MYETRAMASVKRGVASSNRQSSVKAARDNAHYGIHRVDDASWRNEALVAALAYRDAVLAKAEPMSRVEYSRIVRKSNRSGIPGVCRITIRSRAGTAEYPYWLAFWPDPEVARKSKRAKFSIFEHGEEQAKRLAIRARKAGLKQLYGVRIASRNGAFGGD